jgi:hypothetical protein
MCTIDRKVKTQTRRHTLTWSHAMYRRTTVVVDGVCTVVVETIVAVAAEELLHVAGRLPSLLLRLLQDPDSRLPRLVLP